ncbi:hypothetical protein [Photobacterium sanguinicancri]|uniref:hypothetical protein n=1 Tax=Photobacterium sanguinicancri TaxID=875932 RepID=UPI00247FBE86|nr:hypothetical protein [Photobacterium sanguinicancri]
MCKLKQITDELGSYIAEAEDNFMLKKAMAPLRLVLVWMKSVNAKLAELEQRNGGLNG